MTVFGVLFVCTGNLYRSPIAERLFAARLGPAAGGFEVAGAGTHARPGAPLPPAAAGVLAQLGAGTGPFASRRLSADLVAGADLVLGLAREHREAAVRLHPVALRRCFVLEEFVRLADGPPDDPREVVARAAARRGRAPVPRPAADDVEDPAGLPPERLRACADRIDRAVRRAAYLVAAGQLRPAAS
ncbi:low molecular weight phosphatase family protein [Kitasatospora sp. NPDC059571]|uniref:arsenate reductase/protein-tyrosine-phosphatase family protein n=1 Tax=Kitasatospora sp. NPDC059571 TaxID=3346871 RepID=UPI0036B0F1BF